MSKLYLQFAPHLIFAFLWRSSTEVLVIFARFLSLCASSQSNSAAAVTILLSYIKCAEHILSTPGNKLSLSVPDGIVLLLAVPHY